MRAEKKLLVVSTVGILVCVAGCSSFGTLTRDTSEEKTVFQTSGWWKPVTDVRADAVIIYGADDYAEMTFEERVESWRSRGYKTHFMTGIAWGGYSEYFTGKWDGSTHWDEGQITAAGDTIWHGYQVPYIVPVDSYVDYIKRGQVKKAIDAGIDAIYLEEPEYWARAGYSDAFKTEWQKFYGFPWRPQHESAENTYLSNKLKYHLYYNALSEVFTYAKEYGRSKGMDVRCYVPTHSLLNYSAWSIVSPEASLASLSCVDGYIAQVWTGTSRTPNHYDGVREERVFETAFLEYGSMESMTAPTGRKVFFLTDPIEDWPRDWDDYRRNYQATFTAQLFYPTIADYEVMTWPDRIYEGVFFNPASGIQERIPGRYATQMQVMVNTLGNMPKSDCKVSGTDGICVMMSNSLMFQQGVEHKGYSNPDFADFFGRSMPLLKKGIPVRTMHIENVRYPATWQNAEVVILSYSDMKPMEADSHGYIADWVKSGGSLVYCGRDNDPYQSVMEWWNTGKNSFSCPSAHLFSLLGIPEKASDGVYCAGKGKVYVIRQDPKEFVLEKGGAGRFIEVVCQAYCDATGESVEEKNSFYLERGPYRIAAVLDETGDNSPLTLSGKFVDLFDPELSVTDGYMVYPGQQALLYDLSSLSGRRPRVVASAARGEEESWSHSSYGLLLKSPAGTENVMRVYFRSEPESVSVSYSDGSVATVSVAEWDEESSTYLLSFSNSPDGVRVVFKL